MSDTEKAYLFSARDRLGNVRGSAIGFLQSIHRDHEAANGGMTLRVLSLENELATIPVPVGGYVMRYRGWGSDYAMVWDGRES